MLIVLHNYSEDIFWMLHLKKASALFDCLYIIILLFCVLFPFLI